MQKSVVSVALAYVPLIAIRLVDVKAVLEPVLHRQPEFVWPRLPDLALPVDATSQRRTIRVLQRRVV